MRPCWIAALALLGCSPDDEERVGPDAPRSWQGLERTDRLPRPAEALDAGADGSLWAVADGSLWCREPGGDWVDSGRGDLPPGAVPFVGAADGAVLAFVWGKGLYRSGASCGDTPTWELAEDGLDAPILDIVSPVARPIPWQLEGDWLAGAAGVFRTDDSGRTWELAMNGAGTDLALLFTDLATAPDGQLWATSALPSSLLPPEFEGLLKGTLFRSADDGETWVDATDGLPSLFPMGLAFRPDDGVMYVGTQDQGVLRRTESGWAPLGGPSDVVAMEWHAGGLHVASASRGVWRWDDGHWSGVGTGPAIDVEGGVGLLADGLVAELAPDEGELPAGAGDATVHIALSFHVNYYHSYRGDSPDDDGFGLDIDVIRNTLDWLDARPHVRADWNSDNAFTTDDWMPEYSPDVLDRIAARVADGTDDVRLMSWNNGAMAWSTRPEFDAAVVRGIASNEAAFGEMVPGVQPQENMITPEQLGWYADHDIEWITLFNATNGFTALREDVVIEGRDAFNPVELYDPEGDGSLTLVPVYHHADVLDHGGLAGWARQLHDSHDGDVLLVVHFDADAESWFSFDDELDALRGLDFVQYTTIQEYLDDHEAVGRYPLVGDVADGTGDGFGSWAEKDLNHEIATEVARARADEALARYLAGDVPEVAAAADAALTPRLLTLSTTNFGLAAPYLHPDRVESARGFAATARAEAAAALDLAAAEVPVAPGTLEIVNPRDSAGPALVQGTVRLPPGAWSGPDFLRVFDGAGEVPVSATLIGSEPGEDLVGLSMVIDVQPQSTVTLDWRYGPLPGQGATGTLNAGDAPELAALEPPFTECAGAMAEGAPGTFGLDADPRGLAAFGIQPWTVPTCDGEGTLVRTVTRWEGLPGTVVEVTGTMGSASTPEDLQSVALSPLRCEQAEALTWQTLGGAVRTRPVREPVETWNGQAADGWARLTCGGQPLSVAHRVTDRTSIAFLPLRNEGGSAVLAPLGALYGDGPWHEARQLGGSRLGEIVVPTVGVHFRTQAADWSGAEVSYTLLVGDEVDEGVMDLFAHPPRVRAGSFVVP